MKNGKATVDEEKITIAFLYGRQYERTKTDIERFAESIGAVRSEVTSGMGALLSGTKEIWQILRTSNSVLVRMDTVKGSKTKRGRVESSNKSRKKPLEGVAGSQKGYKYKKGTHWMQKPENKARVSALMRARHKKRKAA